MKAQRNTEIKEAFDYLYLNEQHLTAGQVDFIRGLRKYFARNKTLSELQTEALLRIRKYLKVPDRIRFVDSMMK